MALFAQPLNSSFTLEESPTIPLTKTERLAVKTEELQAKLGRTGTLTGLNDADSLIIDGQGTRSDTPDNFSRFSDAVELQHNLDKNNQGSLEFFDFNKGRDGVESRQRTFVAERLGKPVEQVTRQDFIDVGNQQQIQKLGNLVRSPGEPEFKAPFIKGVTQTNLTENQFDEFGNPVNIPLDIPINFDVTGQAKGRDVVREQNPETLEVVSDTAFFDPLQNTTAPGLDPAQFEAGKLVQHGVDSLPKNADGSINFTAIADGTEGDGKISNLVDATQFGVGRKAAGIADALVDTVTRAGLEGYKALTGATEEEAVKTLVANSSLFERDPETGDFIGLDKFKTAEYYGYDNTGTIAALEEIGNADGIQDTAIAIISNADIAPELFLESIGELLTGPLKIPGLILNSTDYANQLMEDIQKEQDGEVLTNGQRAVATVTGLAQAAVNKLGADEMLGRTKLVQTLVNKSIATGTEKSAKKLLKGLAKGALVVAGKAGYEGIEEVIQEGMGIVGEKYALDAEDIFDDKTTTELKQAFGGGFLGGGAPAAGGQVISAISDAVPENDLKGNLNTKVTDIANKIKGDARVAGDNAVKAAVEANPDISKAEQDAVRKAATELNKTKDVSIGTDSQLDESAPVSKDAVVTALKAEDKVATTNPSPEVDAFDTTYDAALNALSVNAKTGEGLEGKAEDSAIEAAMKGSVVSHLEKLGKVLADAKEAGATDNQITKMEEKISRVLAVSATEGKDALLKIMRDNSVDTSEKVRSVLGSRETTEAEIVEALQLKDLTPLDRAKLNVRRDALKTLPEVGVEKMVGGGVSPGLFQWVSTIGADGNISQQAKEAIQGFVSSQRRKLKALKDAKATWEASLAKAKKDGAPLDELFGEKGRVYAKYGNGKELWYQSSAGSISTIASDGILNKVEAEQKPLEDLLTLAEGNIPKTEVEKAEEVVAEDKEVKRKAKQSSMPKPSSTKSESTTAPTAVEETSEDKVIEGDVKAPVESPSTIVPQNTAPGRGPSQKERLEQTTGKPVTIEKELMSIAIEGETEYTAATKEAIKRLIRATPLLVKRLTAMGIDVKGC